MHLYGTVRERGSEREMSRVRLRRPSEWRASLDISTVESVEECKRAGQTCEIGRRRGQTCAEGGQSKDNSRASYLI